MRAWMMAAVALGAFGCTPSSGNGNGGDGPACEIPTCEGEYQLAVVLSGGGFEDSVDVYRPEDTDLINDPKHRIVGYICTLYMSGVPRAPSAGWSGAVWMLPADEPGVDGEIVVAYSRTPCSGEIEEVSCGEGQADFLAIGHPSRWANPERVAETECGETPAE